MRACLFCRLAVDRDVHLLAAGFQMMRRRALAALSVVVFFQAEAGIRDYKVTGVQTCALPIFEDDSCRNDAHASSDAAERRGVSMSQRYIRNPETSGIGKDEAFDRKSVPVQPP